jgi:hypothetical protein
MKLVWGFGSTSCLNSSAFQSVYVDDCRLVWWDIDAFLWGWVLPGRMWDDRWDGNIEPPAYSRGRCWRDSDPPVPLRVGDHLDGKRLVLYSGIRGLFPLPCLWPWTDTELDQECTAVDPFDFSVLAARLPINSIAHGFVRCRRWFGLGIDRENNLTAISFSWFADDRAETRRLLDKDAVSFARTGGEHDAYAVVFAGGSVGFRPRWEWGEEPQIDVVEGRGLHDPISQLLSGSDGSLRVQTAAGDLYDADLDPSADRVVWRHADVFQDWRVVVLRNNLDHEFIWLNAGLRRRCGGAAAVVSIPTNAPIIGVRRVEVSFIPPRFLVCVIDACGFIYPVWIECGDHFVQHARLQQPEPINPEAPVVLAA